MKYLSHSTSAGALTALAIVLCAAVSLAESKPPVEKVAQRGVLIVKCKTEIKDEMVNYRVLESWKGKYGPELFYVKPRDGYLYLHGVDAKGLGGVKDGQEVIVFYSDNALSGDSDNKGKIDAHRHDDVLPVVAGKVVWQPGEPHSTVYTLEELKKAVLAAVAKDPKVPTPRK